MKIKKICVLGVGLMGNGIVQVCAQEGCQEAGLRSNGCPFFDGA
jgi:3-hydroxyacyl-CoA dehydrogenase